MQIFKQEKYMFSLMSCKHELKQMYAFTILLQYSFVTFCVVGCCCSRDGQKEGQ